MSLANFIDKKINTKKNDDELKSKFEKFHNDSTDFRKEFINKYGEILTSIWDAKYNKKLSTYDIKGQNVVWHEKLQAKGITPEISKFMAVRNKSVRGKDKFSVSKFPANIARRIYRFYTKELDTVFDPCAGHNSRMQSCFEENRIYIGYDISKDYMKLNNEIKEKLYKQKTLIERKNYIELYNRSSTNIHLQDNSVDLIFTSPPYWDIEFYGEEPEQAGYKKTYEQFLNIMKQIYLEAYRILKPGKFCIINVNDFRKDGIFYTYHGDTIKLLKEIGFKAHDIVIMKWSNAMQAAFATQLEERKQTAKIHEYILVFKK